MVSGKGFLSPSDQIMRQHAAHTSWLHVCKQLDWSLQAIKARSEAERKKQEKKAALARPTRANSFPSRSPSHAQQAEPHTDNQSQPNAVPAAPAAPQAADTTAAFPSPQPKGGQPPHQPSQPQAPSTQQANDAHITAATSRDPSQHLLLRSSDRPQDSNEAQQAAHQRQDGNDAAGSSAAQPGPLRKQAPPADPVRLGVAGTGELEDTIVRHAECSASIAPCPLGVTCSLYLCYSAAGIGQQQPNVTAGARAEQLAELSNALKAQTRRRQNLQTSHASLPHGLAASEQGAIAACHQQKAQ